MLRVMLQCCAAAFIENLNAESLSIRTEDFDRYMSGAATPHDPSQVISDTLVTTTITKIIAITKLLVDHALSNIPAYFASCNTKTCYTEMSVL